MTPGTWPDEPDPMDTPATADEPALESPALGAPSGPPGASRHRAQQRLLRVGTWGQTLTHLPGDGQPQRLVHEVHVRPGAADDALTQAQNWLVPLHPSLHPLLHAEVMQPPGSPAQVLRLERPMPRGTPLGQVLGRTGALDELAVAALFADLARGVQEAHLAGLVVGNLQLDTLLVAAPGSDASPPLLAVDAGAPELLAAALGHALQPETPVFAQWLPGLESVAPEVLAGSVPVAASDVFALAATMAHALLGRPLFVAPSLAVLRQRLAVGVQPTEAMLLMQRAPKLGAVLAKALAPQPWARSGALADLVAALTSLTAKVPTCDADGRTVLDAWSPGSPLIPLAAYASAAPWSAQFAETPVQATAPATTPASAQDQAKLRMALDQLEMERLHSQQRSARAGRNLLTRLILVVLFALIAAAIAATAMREARRVEAALHPPLPADTALPRPPKPVPVPRVLFESRKP